MKAAFDKLNPYALAFENAQTLIREIVKKAFLRQVPMSAAREAIIKVIEKATQNEKIPRLQDAGRRSLWAFAENQLQTWRSMDVDAEMLLFLGEWRQGKQPAQTSAYIGTEAANGGGSISPRVYDMGVPLQQYYKDVWENKVKPIIDRLVEDTPLDPNDITGRNSLRNLAEMEVRYNGHLDNIAELKNAGVKIVVCSSHADCSDRCAPWQGRLYSLDGTSGTIDGHKYIPLEVATDIYYTTKAGITYKNGLLGFNCLHHLEQYRGELLPQISSEQRKKEYDITKQQRAMERAVRKVEAKAITLKDIDARAARQAKREATKLYQKYMDFSVANNRAFYPSRIEI